jgi:DNA-directed RNA polymerase subunit RPC12/RpoP
MKTCFRYFFPFSILQGSDDHTYAHLKCQQSVSLNPWQLSALKQPITHESSTKGSPGYLGMVLCDTIVFKGAHRTITGVGCTHMVGLRLWRCRSCSHRYFVKALTVWMAVITAQNSHITMYGTERFVPSLLSTTVSPLGSSKFCQVPLTPATSAPTPTLVPVFNLLDPAM